MQRAIFYSFVYAAGVEALEASPPVPEPKRASSTVEAA